MPSTFNSDIIFLNCEEQILNLSGIIFRKTYLYVLT